MLPLAEFIAKRYKKVAEVGIGNYTLVAEELQKKGVKVIATDKRRIECEVEFYVDDVTNPNIKIYEGVELIYSIRPPLELYSSIRLLAKKVNADCIIKPLYNEYADGKLMNYKGISFYLWKPQSII